MSVRVTCAIFTLIGLCVSSSGGYFNLEVGDPCPTPDYRSSCQPPEQCSTLTRYLQTGRLRPEAILNCGFTVRGEKICCPIDTSGEQMLRISPGDATTKRTTTTTTTTTTSTTTTTTTAKPTTTTATTRTTQNAPWLSLFKTNREYLQRSVAQTNPYPTRDSLVFPDTTGARDDECRTPLYEGKCMAISQCDSVGKLLSQQRLRDEEVLSCRDGTTEEIICCPVSVPLQPRTQITTDTRVGEQSQSQAEVAANREGGEGGGAGTTTTTTPVGTTSAVYKHLAALAFPNAAVDGYVHRCTAVLLTPQLLLTSAGCRRPSHAVFGVADLRDLDEDEDDLVEIMNEAIYKEDLAVLRLQYPRPQHEAPICSHYEQTRAQVRGQLVVSGWAKSDAGDCPLYELPMRLLPSAACQQLGNASKVPDLPARHMCLEPSVTISNIPQADSCAPCPAEVGGVLHLLRPNGTRCVMAVATPTSTPTHSGNCSSSTPVMYFSTLLDRQLVDFVNRQL